MCIRCSGIHRGLGVHITFVRSVSLDEWNSKQVKNMVRWGNKRANEYWEANVPEDYYIPDENDGVNIVERWIRDKYEKGRFKAKKMPAFAEEDIDLTRPIADLVNHATKSSAAAPAAEKEKKKKTEKVEEKAPAASKSSAPAPAPANAGGSELFDLFDAPAPAPATQAASKAAAQPVAASTGGATDDFFASFSTSSAPAKPAIDLAALYGSKPVGGGAAATAFTMPGMRPMTMPGMPAYPSAVASNPYSLPSVQSANPYAAAPQQPVAQAKPAASDPFGDPFASFK
jgi:Putative GTPase activating protein for Arf